MFEVLHYYRAHGGLRRDYRWYMKYGYVASWLRRIIGIMNPRVNSIRLRMTLQQKYFNDTVPDRLPLKLLGDWDAFQVTRLRLVQVLNYVVKFLNMSHTARTKSSTVQKVAVTPAAIAGVQRSVLWRFTKL